MKEVGRKGDNILVAAATDEEKEFFKDTIYAVNINQRREPWFMTAFYKWRTNQFYKKLAIESEKKRMAKVMAECSLPIEIKELFCWCQTHKKKKIRLTRATCPVSIDDKILPEWNSNQRIRPGKLMGMITKEYN